MSTKSLGRLEKVDLREAWLSEPGDFTPWLAREEDLRLLGETIGIDLQCEAQEKEVGPFRADILCKDRANDNWVLIENQLEKTDHCHLGQLFTYAAGLNAVTIVWIAKRFTDEHRAALDWLNEHTDQSINLFGLEVELWRIGDSPVAPKFNVISQPNDWTKFVTTGGDGQLTEAKRLQLKFWLAFREYMQEKSTLKSAKPYPQHWMYFSFGMPSGIRLAAIFSMWDSESKTWSSGELRAELNVDNSQSATYFSHLKRHKDEIEASIGSPMVWYEAEGVRGRRAYIRQTVDVRNEAAWPEYFEWLRANLERLSEVFSPIVKRISQDMFSVQEMSE